MVPAGGLFLCAKKSKTKTEKKDNAYSIPIAVEPWLFHSMVVKLSFASLYSMIKYGLTLPKEPLVLELNSSCSISLSILFYIFFIIQISGFPGWYTILVRISATLG
jgi:hypothetical protein